MTTATETTQTDTTLPPAGEPATGGSGTQEQIDALKSSLASLERLLHDIRGEEHVEGEWIKPLVRRDDLLVFRSARYGDRLVEASMAPGGWLVRVGLSACGARAIADYCRDSEGRTDARSPAQSSPPRPDGIKQVNVMLLPPDVRAALEALAR